MLLLAAGAAGRAKAQRVAMESSRGEEGTVVEEFGESWETSNSHVVCGSILLSKVQRRGFGMMPRGRSNKEYKVSGSRNLFSRDPGACQKK